MISFTLAIAFGVRVTGCEEAGVPVTTSAVGVTVADDIESPCLRLLKCMPPETERQALGQEVGVTHVVRCMRSQADARDDLLRSAKYVSTVTLKS
jgi:hypothetical protein